MSLSADKKRRNDRIKLIAGSSALLIGAFLYYKYVHSGSICCATKQKSSCCATEQKSSCCGAGNPKKQDFNSHVQSRYSATARNFESAYTESEQDKLRSIAKVFGYSAEELAQIGSDANMGLSCGNPVKQANLKKGEIVLDLGCGAGMDLFLAKPLIGDAKDGGQLLGVDFSQDMIDKAMRNAQRRKERSNLDISNMKFMYSDIEDMKKVIENDSVDCVISNCVVNLVPNKLKAFKDVYRLLKPGGRICLSDIALKQALPKEVHNDVTMFVNCISGAVLAWEYEALLYEAGFKQVQMVDKKVDLNVWKGSWESMVGCGVKGTDKAALSCCGAGGCGDEISADKAVHMSAEEKEKMKKLLDEMDFNDYVASYYVFGYKNTK
eukprot:221921_1